MYEARCCVAKIALYCRQLKGCEGAHPGLWLATHLLSVVVSSVEQARLNLTSVLLSRLPVSPAVVDVSAASSSMEATVWGTSHGRALR